MNTKPTKISRALISVSDKTGIIPFAQELHAMGVSIISTGGTAKLLTEAGVPNTEISQVTNFPEMMDGRVKTLHPMIHGGILGLRDEHAQVASEQGIDWIDLVVCNLYPFKATIEKPDTDLDTAIENIDIGGPTMIRSAAKNVGWVTVVVEPSSYTSLIEALKTHGTISYEQRLAYCAAAFRHTAQYDALIQQYLTKEQFPEAVTLTFEKFSDMRYGENPHQAAAAYRAVLPPSQRDTLSLLDAEILNGKQLSYNNINDATGTLETLREFSEPACVVVKHANPCGAATGTDITEVTIRAFEADKLSAFGGLVAINRTCTVEIAQYFRKIFFEILMAPDYEPEALEILKKKKDLRILKIGTVTPLNTMLVGKMVSGGMLLQERDTKTIEADDLQVVTERVPTPKELEDMLFGWKVLKHVKSNAILVAKDAVTLGIGPGQVSRVDAVKIAVAKSITTEAAILASDAFFPFRDSIDSLASTGIKAIIQPGGSIRDQEVIDACNEYGIAMVFTGFRCFNHG